MPPWLDDFLFTYQTLIDSLGVNGLLALSVYVVLAVGQLSLGQAAFMGLGAYSGAILTTRLGLPFAAVLPLSVVVPVGFALAIGVPTLRLAGVYLAIATIGLGEVLRAVYNNTDYLGGALGISGIPERAGFASIFGTLVASIAVLWLVGRSRIGRAMEAMREDETAAQVMGVNVRRYRMGAFVASAVLAGLAGCLSAHVSSFIGPNEYGFNPAVTILSFALLGGLGTPLAPVLGAWSLTLLSQVVLGDVDKDYGLVVNGLIIVVAVLFLPGGLFPWRMRRA